MSVIIRTRYLEGGRAAFEGKELWENPYSGLDSNPRDFHEWFIGWCNAKLLEKKQNEQES